MPVNLAIFLSHFIIRSLLRIYFITKWRIIKNMKLAIRVVSRVLKSPTVLSGMMPEPKMLIVPKIITNQRTSADKVILANFLNGIFAQPAKKIIGLEVL